ncbi:hypothetical protein TREMEDRAFT_58104 [Tremella mesenterica DSM 1558]|uniref:uncharacterized protein n=1 Tax=Tremella mesenterica (strain ATCC 24925 / CBS 8224 / DSM 1558 / NBRC 9311 / NRRL Y-6157 / RJB 2259-6 / UBC 559-6) TaxID=578456 RepID=UPI0003F494D6|nr:uncharacterized protein TREMEDRAFT_58104 [Tremella mesenterica DSM 1558]EIW71961.1 hypothetical protein TREMEDRAFT_58104 [Tremella mesenterica DSM 1558]
MDVDAEIDELLSVGGSRKRSEPDVESDIEAELDPPSEVVEAEGEQPVGDLEQGVQGSGEVKCLWGECDKTFEKGEELVQHMHSDHVGVGQGSIKQGFRCEWRGCPRKGQKQASRHSLITHTRAHTGERPYTCSHPGCGKSFTRSDAMQKHLKSLHGPDSHLRKRPGPPPRPASQILTGNLYSASFWSSPGMIDLMSDPDLAPTLMALRSRDPLWPPTPAEEDALESVRKAQPGPRPKKPRSDGIRVGSEVRGVKRELGDDGERRMRNRDRDDETGSDLGMVGTEDREERRGNREGELGKEEEINSELDDFDEGVGNVYQHIPPIIGMVPDPDDPEREVPVYGRSKWQVKWLMAKAKFMLLVEENQMRRMDLNDVRLKEEELKKIHGITE